MKRIFAKQVHVVSNEQLNTLHDLVEEGLVIERENAYQLSILGEVFLGHIVKLLKKPEGQAVLDAYIAEGYAIGDAIRTGKISQDNEANDRQTVLERLR